jgi:hypothetical protein
MSSPEHKDKVEEEKQLDIKKTKEYRNFKRLLKVVIKAPPMPKRGSGTNELVNGDKRGLAQGETPNIAREKA